MSNIQIQTQFYQDHCWIVLEIPKPEDLIKALKWLLRKEKMEKDLDLDASVKITYTTLSSCDDTQCYKTFDRISIEKVEYAEVVKWSRKVDGRRWENTVIVIPKKFSDSKIVLKHENEYGTHYHVIYISAVVEGAVNGWKETVIFEDDP